MLVITVTKVASHRLFVSIPLNRFSYLKALLNRAFVGQQARELLNPAAWMVSELKKSGLWDELASAKLMS